MRQRRAGVRARKAGKGEGEAVAIYKTSIAILPSWRGRFGPVGTARLTMSSCR